jgi:hypothetical protein
MSIAASGWASAQMVEKIREVLERASHVRQIGGAHLRQTQAARQPLEQRVAQMLLERAHLMAHGGRGQVQVARRLGEAHMAGAGLEGPEPVQRWHAIGHQETIAGLGLLSIKLRLP